MKSCCTYCRREMDPTGTKSLLEQTADHTTPFSRGGLETKPCCWQCNQLKRAMSPEQWAAFMEANPNWWEKPECQMGRGDGLRIVPPSREWLQRKAERRRRNESESVAGTG